MTPQGSCPSPSSHLKTKADPVLETCNFITPDNGEVPNATIHKVLYFVRLVQYNELSFFMKLVIFVLIINST